MTEADTTPTKPEPVEKAKPTWKSFSLRRLAILLLMMFTLIGSVLGVGGCMVMAMPGDSYHGPFAELTPDEAETQEQLIQHVQKLAGEIGIRSFKQPGSLEAAGDYIRTHFESNGLTVQMLPYTATFRGEPVTTHNIEAVIPGTDKASEIIVIGAHYDTVYVTPGANDNASGVAVMLELARRIGRQPRSRTVRLVAFSTEEPPFFQHEEMGSLIYARQCRAANDDIRGMISLETMGFYSEEANTQNYPSDAIKPFYPDRANFVAFVADFGSRDFVRQCIGSFRSHTKFPTEGIAAPPGMSGIGFSDHWSFRQVDYPAIMITDTAMLRYEPYHRAEDTPEKLDYARMARITMGIVRMMDDLAGPASDQPGP